MARQFNSPDEIKEFGQMVNDFSISGKTLGHALGKFGLPEDEIFQIVGEGLYNSLSAKQSNFILYGKHLTKPLSGLFGAFVHVHLPEMAITRRLPILMGEAGFKLKVKSPDGKQAQFPLQQVAFDFVERKNTEMQGRASGRIILREPLKSDSLEIPTGTPLTSSNQSLLWAANPYQFSIIDVSGMGVSQKTACSILWGSLGAQGMKLLESESRRLTLQLDGTDDDFSAEQYLISALKVLGHTHGFKVMDVFNRLVEQQAEKIGGKIKEAPAYFLAAMRLYQIGEKSLRQNKGVPEDILIDSLFGKEDMSYRDTTFVRQASRFIESLQRTLTTFGLTLPTSLEGAPTLQKIVDKVERYVQTAIDEAPEKHRQRKEKQLQELLKRKQQALPITITDELITSSHPFSMTWLREEGGNALKENIRSFQISLEDIRETVRTLLPDAANPDKAGKLRGDVREKLHRNAMSIWLTEIGDVRDALASLAAVTVKDAKDIYAAARDSMNDICKMFKEQPGGFACPPHMLSAVEAALNTSETMAKRAKNRKLRKRHHLTRARKAREFVAIARAVEGDFGSLIRRFGECPALDRLGIFDILPTHPVRVLPVATNQNAFSPNVGPK